MAKRLDCVTSRDLANLWRIDLEADFHSLDSDAVRRVLNAADSVGYSEPKHANGSRARYFHAYLQRAARRPK